MSLTEEGMRERKWRSYEVLGKLLENQEPLLSSEEKTALCRASTYYFDTEYWLDCLDIYRRLRGYEDRSIQPEGSPSFSKKEFVELLDSDLKQLEDRIRDISSKFTEVGDDIKRLRKSILRGIVESGTPSQ
jgi:hypothetical protein